MIIFPARNTYCMGKVDIVGGVILYGPGRISIGNQIGMTPIFGDQLSKFCLWAIEVTRQLYKNHGILTLHYCMTRIREHRNTVQADK
jgi:hypothetical protein